MTLYTETTIVVYIGLLVFGLWLAAGIVAAWRGRR
jgi:hypothetical protein